MAPSPAAMKAELCLRAHMANAQTSTVVVNCSPLPALKQEGKAGDSRIRQLSRADRALACSAIVLRTICSSERAMQLWELCQRLCQFLMAVRPLPGRPVSGLALAALTNRKLLDLRNSMLKLWNSSPILLRARLRLAVDRRQ